MVFYTIRKTCLSSAGMARHSSLRRRVWFTWCVLSLTLFAACAGTPAPAPSPLDAAIRDAAAYLHLRLPAGGKIAILNIQSDYPAVSEYVIEGLTELVVNGGLLTVVDRQNLALIQKEMNYQLSGEVDDETARSIGKKLGAQFIIAGAFAPLGTKYMLRIRAIDVETARIQGQKSYILPVDSLLASLMAGGAAPHPAATTHSAAVPQVSSTGLHAAAPAGAAQYENYPPELDRRLAELSALPPATDSAALIAQRNAWAALLAYVASYYQNHLEFAVVYDPSIVQGDIDYNRATVTARVAVQLAPLSGYRKAIAAVIAALHKTGKSVEWGWGTWPGEIEFRGAGAMRATYFINYENIFNPQMPGPTTGGTRSEFLVADIGRRYREQHFIDSEIAAFGKVVTVRAVLQNEQGEAIARAEQRLRFAVAYRDSVAAAGPGSARPRPSTGIIFAPLAIPEWFIFHGVKAADLSGSTAFRVISIDGVPLASHAGDYVVIRTETIKR